MESAPAPRATAAASPSLVLLTLDTTRADHVGCYGAAGARTPALDALAARGTRYARAVTSVPLTLPAHCSLLTGLDPPAHGVHDNGTAVLPAEIPTLATVLAARGYRTGAFVGSRVLDRRFGLARGFATYDDAMTAERMGEQGYPERDGAAVTRFLAWLAREAPKGGLREIAASARMPETRISAQIRPSTVETAREPTVTMIVSFTPVSRMGRNTADCVRKRLIRTAARAPG